MRIDFSYKLTTGVSIVPCKKHLTFSDNKLDVITVVNFKKPSKATSFGKVNHGISFLLPADYLFKVGFVEGSVLHIFEKDGKIVIEKVNQISLENEGRERILKQGRHLILKGE